MSIKNTNPKTRSRVRFNLIDFVIILAVLASVAGIYVRYNFSFDEMKNEDNFVEAEVEFLILNVTEQLADALVAGSPVFDSQNKKQMGELSAIVQKLPAEIFVTMEDGSIIKTYSNALRYDVRGIITVKGIQTEKGFLCQGENYIAPGASMVVLTPEVDFNMLITNINLKK
ncbi:MAG: DUF4330 domain-containing protein [Clostridiales bacterium]|nr:DUF4330 domain-containing protein [Clostridiales bacterium]